jgi:serine/threonine-protein kinase
VGSFTIWEDSVSDLAKKARETPVLPRGQSERSAQRSWADVPTPAEGIVLELRPDQIVADKYRLLRHAGFGGMGAVWVARNEATGAEVALKVLLADKAESPEAAARFRREAYAAAQLAHRGIVRVFDLVELGPPHEGSLVMVMELLRGETLADRMDKQERFTVEETLEVIVPLLSALAHAHRAGIIHRDLKPENVFLAVDPDGHVTPKILDFGISKLTSVEVPSITGDGATLGTPSYMSPEQARGSPDIDARSDVFTVGILMYEMLSGKNPFQDAAYHSVVAAILEREPEPIPDIPEGINAVLKTALAKRPEDRFGSASELATALRNAAHAGGLTFDGDKSITPIPWNVALRAQAAAVGAPSSVVEALAEPVIPLARGRVSDATELSLRTIEKREQQRRSRIGLTIAGIAALGVVIGGVALFIFLRPPKQGAATSAPSATTQTTSLAGSAETPAATFTGVVPVVTPLATAAATAPPTAGGKPTGKPTSTAKPPATGAGTAAGPATAAVTAKSTSTKPAGVIKDPGF